MGGMENVVVNAVVRTLTHKAVGKAINTAKSSSGKKREPDQSRVPRRARKVRGESLLGVEERGGLSVGF